MRTVRREPPHDQDIATLLNQSSSMHTHPTPDLQLKYLAVYFPVTGVTLFHPESYRPSGVNLSPEQDTVAHVCNSHVQHGAQKHVLSMVSPLSNTDGRNRTRNLDISGSRKMCKFPSAWRNTTMGGIAQV